MPNGSYTTGFGPGSVAAVLEVDLMCLPVAIVTLIRFLFIRSTFQKFRPHRGSYFLHESLYGRRAGVGSTSFILVVRVL